MPYDRLKLHNVISFQNLCGFASVAIMLADIFGSLNENDFVRNISSLHEGISGNYDLFQRFILSEIGVDPSQETYETLRHSNIVGKLFNAFSTAEYQLIVGLLLRKFYYRHVLLECNDAGDFGHGLFDTSTPDTQSHQIRNSIRERFLIMLNFCQWNRNRLDRCTFKQFIKARRLEKIDDVSYSLPLLFEVAKKLIPCLSPDVSIENNDLFRLIRDNEDFIGRELQKFYDKFYRLSSSPLASRMPEADDLTLLTDFFSIPVVVETDPPLPDEHNIRNNTSRHEESDANFTLVSSDATPHWVVEGKVDAHIEKNRDDFPLGTMLDTSLTLQSQTLYRAISNPGCVIESAYQDFLENVRSVLEIDLTDQERVSRTAGAASSPAEPSQAPFPSIDLGYTLPEGREAGASPRPLLSSRGGMIFRHSGHVYTEPKHTTVLLQLTQMVERDEQAALEKLTEDLDFSQILELLGPAIQNAVETHASDDDISHLHQRVCIKLIQAATNKNLHEFQNKRLLMTIDSVPNDRLKVAFKEVINERPRPSRP